MSWILTKEEVDAILKLDGEKRYHYAIKKIADQELIWGLWKDSGWALSGCNGGEMIPVWPHQDYAKLCANEAWSGYSPKSIDVDVWLERWIPGLSNDQRLIAVFPTPNNKGVAVLAIRFGEELREEMFKYED